MATDGKIIRLEQLDLFKDKLNRVISVSGINKANLPSLVSLQTADYTDSTSLSSIVRVRVSFTDGTKTELQRVSFNESSGFARFLNNDYILDFNIYLDPIYNYATLYANPLGTIDLTPQNGSGHPVSSGGVFDAIQDLKEGAAGKCSTFVFSTVFTKIENGYLWYLDEHNVEQSYAPTTFNVYNSATKEWENKATALSQGTYNGLTIVNRTFDSSDSVIDFSSGGIKYLIIGYYGEFSLLNVADYDGGTAISKYPLKTGDNFYITETDVPDRWYGDRSFFALESKVDLTIYAQKVEVPQYQATTTIVGNALTNINGRVLTNFEQTSQPITINNVTYDTIVITYQSAQLTYEKAQDYMEYMTGSRFVPTYNLEKPQNSIWIMADGTVWKPQFDSTSQYHFQLWKINGVTTSNNNNLQNGTGTNAVQQKMADATVDFTGRNPNAIAADPSLATTIPTGASGDQANAFGKNTMARATAATAMGNKCLADAEESLSQGYQCVTLRGADGSHAQGNETTSGGKCAHSEGLYTQAMEDESHSEGNSTATYAKWGHSEGVFTTVKGNYIITTHDVDPSPIPPEPVTPTPTPEELDALNGVGAHSEGHYNFSFGLGSHTEGHGNKGYARFSHAEGGSNQAGPDLVLRKTEDGKDYYTIDHTKQYQHASGYQTKAIGTASYTGGWGTITNYDFQTAIGKWNDNKQDTLFEVGNGADDNNRGNAFEVHSDGRATIGAAPVNSMDVVNKGSLKTVNGQSLVGTGNIQISVNQTGLFKHKIYLSNLGQIEAINNNSSQYLPSSSPDNIGETLQDVFTESIKMVYADMHNISNNAVVLNAYYSDSAKKLSLVVSYYDHANNSAVTTLIQIDTTVVTVTDDVVTSI